MELTPPTVATSAIARRTDATPGDAGAAANELAGDFETFLTLLTAQLKNQDPLKPMESTEFVAQLANFSSVEQQVRTNDRLDEIAAALGGDTSTGLAAWIGREVRAPGKAAFSGVPVEVEVQPLKDVDQAVLVVRNDFDQVVARRAVDPTAASVVWDGTNEAGTEAAHGVYALRPRDLPRRRDRGHPAGAGLRHGCGGPHERGRACSGARQWRTRAARGCDRPALGLARP